MGDSLQVDDAFPIFVEPDWSFRAGPAKLAQALLTITALEQPPRRFIAGADAIALAERKVVDLQQQINAYRDLSTSLAYDDEAAGGVLRGHIKVLHSPRASVSVTGSHTAATDEEQSSASAPSSRPICSRNKPDRLVRYVFELASQAVPDCFSRESCARTSCLEVRDIFGTHLIYRALSHLQNIHISREVAYAGGGTRTPDTRIMIPLL